MCILCHVDAVTVKSHFLVLVVEDITKGILENGQDKLSLVDFASSSTKIRLGASKITLPIERSSMVVVL